MSSRSTFLIALVWALVLLAARAAAALSPQRSALLALVSVPLLYVVFDFAENGMVLALLHAYPSRRDTMAEGLRHVTIIKRVASMLAIVVPVAILAFASLRQRVRSV